MKKIILKATVLITILVFGLGNTNNLNAQTKKHDLKIIVKNIKKSKGSLSVKVWDEEKYMRTNPVKELKIKPGSKSILTVDIKDLPKGEYGISLHLDINGDNKMNRSLVMKPTEPIGFSNNAEANFGPPSYDEIKFSLTKDKSITINYNQFILNNYD